LRAFQLCNALTRPIASFCIRENNGGWLRLPGDEELEFLLEKALMMSPHISKSAQILLSKWIEKALLQEQIDFANQPFPAIEPSKKDTSTTKR